MSIELVRSDNFSNQLRAMHFRGSLGWFKGIAELIDNGFDWGATEITWGFLGPRQFIYRDNGQGCDDPNKMLTFYELHISERGRLGRYGIGAKDMFTWLWGTLEITSRTRTIGWMKTIDWGAVESFSLDDPAWLAGTDNTGFALTVSNIDQRIPSKQELVDLLQRLAFTYSPALYRGQRINFTDKSGLVSLSAPPQPPLQEQMEFEVSVKQKKARVTIGIVTEGEANSYPGLNYTFQYRVIRAKSSLGCGTYSSSRIFGSVELVDDHTWADNDARKWRLSTNKDDFRDAEDLGDLIAAQAEPLLKRASEQSLYVNVENLRRRIELRANRQLGPQLIRGKRKSPTQNGVHSPTGTGKSPKKFENSQPGGTATEDAPRQRDRGLRLEFANFNGTHPGLGEVQIQDVMVTLNKDERHIQKAMQSNDELYLTDAALGLFFHQLQTGGQTTLLPVNLHSLLPTHLHSLVKGAEEQHWFSRRLSENWGDR